MVSKEDNIQIKGFQMKLVTGTVMGKGKIENQDSISVSSNNDLVVIVADGLGSASYSKEGSNRIVQIAPNLIRENNFEQLPNKLLTEWKIKLEGNINQYDTTFKFVYIKPNKTYVGGIGDGWIALINNKNFVSYKAENTFSNQTDSILSFDLKNKFWIKEFETKDVSSILISTDGFSEDIENGDEFLKQVEEEIKNNQHAFTEDLDNTLENWPVETNKDDKTVAFIVINQEDKNE
jgi:serine/threonine protein phosphatase PrpC